MREVLRGLMGMAEPEIAIDEIWNIAERVGCSFEEVVVGVEYFTEPPLRGDLALKGFCHLLYGGYMEPAITCGNNSFTPSKRLLSRMIEHIPSFNPFKGGGEKTSSPPDYNRKFTPEELAELDTLLSQEEPPDEPAPDLSKTINKSAMALLFILLWGTQTQAVESQVIEPQDDKPFICSQSDIVRIRIEMVAGSRIDFEINGPAKIYSKRIVQRRKEGKIVKGNRIWDYELEMTGTGKVNVLATIHSRGEEKQHRYEFTVDK